MLCLLLVSYIEHADSSRSLGANFTLRTIPTQVTTERAVDEPKHSDADLPNKSAEQNNLYIVAGIF